MKERITLTLDKEILDQVDSKIDGLNIKNRSHCVEVLLSQSLGQNRPKIALILAGGKGTRLKPITNEIPKPLVPLHEKPILQHTIDLLKKHNIKEILISIGFKGDKIKEYFGNGKRFGVNIKYIEENEPLGTAGPLNLAKEFLTETFLMCNADELKNINLNDMYLFHKEKKGIGTIALTSVSDPSAYGVANLEGSKIIEFIEKPKKEDAPSNLINSGLYILEPEVLNFVPEGNSMMEKEVFPKIAKKGKLFGYHFSGQWFDTGTMERYEKAMEEWNGID